MGLAECRGSERDREWACRVPIRKIDGFAKVYHATCRAEQMSSVVAARLLATEPRARSASRSPKGTPQPELPRTGPSAMKRKAEEEDGEAKRVKIESVEENLDMPIPLVNGIQTEAPVKLEMPEELVEDEHEIQVIPPTPESGTKTNENEIVASLDEVEEKGINGGGDHDGDERMSIQEGSEEREFEPDLEVELDPEPEETS